VGASSFNRKIGSVNRWAFVFLVEVY